MERKNVYEGVFEAVEVDKHGRERDTVSVIRFDSVEGKSKMDAHVHTDSFPVKKGDKVELAFHVGHAVPADVQNPKWLYVTHQTVYAVADGVVHSSAGGLLAFVHGVFRNGSLSAGDTFWIAYRLCSL